MIKSAGIMFDSLQPNPSTCHSASTPAPESSLELGGVMEAVLRYAAEKVTGKKLDDVEFQQVRGDSGLREAVVQVNGSELKLAVVHGLRNARVVAEQVRAGKSHYDLIEVMACPAAASAAPDSRDNFDKCACAQNQGPLSRGQDAPTS